RVGLHTCHRVELIGLTAPGAPLRKLPGVQLARGVDAAERVFLVAGGLDSAVVGEEQVLGQVRAAYEGALAAGDTGPILNELLRRAIAFGKRVRSEIPPRTDRSLADSAVRWAGQWLADRRQPTTALVIGTGEMGKLIAQSFAASGMTISVASRSVERARRFVGLLPNAERHRAMPLEEALGSAATHDVVAIAVRSASVPLEAMHLTYRHRVPLVIDLSAPRAVTPAAAEVLGDRLLDLDRLGATSSTPLSDSEDRRLRAAARDAARSFVDWWAKRSSAGAIAILHAHANEIRERHLERLRRRRQLTPEQFAAVETATSAMIGELLHAPTLRLQAEPAARDAVERVFGLES
ncbi:MAG TPA: NAD(P)-binding domain-containing protein, partial [Vicinamibacterales bacterium]|nr:NAD(P)-binding domain-containing protein [Vicinamibacterales bacterium]